MVAYRIRAAAAAAIASVSLGFRAPRHAADAAVDTGSQSVCGRKGGNTSTRSHIVNGQDADECEWKWQVGLRTRAGTAQPKCGGILVAADWVLTSVRCVIQGHQYHEVIAGSLNRRERSGNEQVRTISELFLHPSYSYSKEDRLSDDDFALLKLSSPFDLNGCVGTACLPTSDVPADSKCWITGWGKLQSEDDQPDILQEGEVTVLSKSKCTGLARGFGYRKTAITDAMLCAQGKTNSGRVDSCTYDMGGPLVCESDGVWSVHGVASWHTSKVRDCASWRHPGVWSRVASAREWIDGVLGGTITNSKPTLCPSWAEYQFPDAGEDCKCPKGQKCSLDGVNWNCPTAVWYDGHDGIGGAGGTAFQVDCAACQCYDNISDAA